MHACRIHFTQLSPICRYIKDIAPSLTNNRDNKPTSSCTAHTSPCFTTWVVTPPFTPHVTPTPSSASALI